MYTIMTHRFGTAVLAAATAFCLMTTFSSGAAPEQFAARLGLKIANAGGINEIRAQYAGFFLAAAAVCAAGLAGVVSRKAAFIVLCAVFGGLIAGRLVSLILDRSVDGYGPTILALYAIDSIGFVLAFSALILENRA